MELVPRNQSSVPSLLMFPFPFCNSGLVWLIHASRLLPSPNEDRAEVSHPEGIWTTSDWAFLPNKANSGSSMPFGH